MKGLVKRYLKFMWHYSQAYNLLTVPLSGFSIAMSFFTFLAVAFGFRLPWYGYVIFFAVVLLIVSTLGVLLVQAGLVAFYQSMSNQQSPELLKILELLNGKDR